MGDSGQQSFIMSTPTPANSDSPKSGSDNTVIVKYPENTEYEQSLQIVLGTVCGVFGLLGLLLVLSLLYRFYRKRHHRSHITENRDQELNSSVSVDLEHKQIPSILLLYAYDCAAHEKVVSSLAGYLIETCNCNVHLDVFEDQIINEKGLDDWLIDRLQEADFILVLCSIGGRLRCTKKRVKFKSDPYQRIPDYFAVAVDYVAEKIRVERSKGLAMSRFLVAYMDYSTVSDVPHQLEAGTKFCLMKDVTKLFCHIHGFMSESSKYGSLYPAVSDKYYENSEMGMELKISIESAKEFFKCNPNWVEDGMEFLPPPPSKCKSRLHRKSSLEPLLTENRNDEPSLVDTTVDIHSQSLPHHNMHTEKIKNAVYQLQNRQNSLPMSLSSKALSTPSPTNTSKSFENVKISNNRYSADIETLPCIMCGQHEHKDGRNVCHRRKYRHSHVDDADEDETEFSTVRIKSKSLPAVCDTNLSSSHTVFQADVHKEWGDHERRMSSSDSQESGSNIDLGMDDLQKDLQSIIMPSSLKSEQLASHGHDIVPNSKSFSMPKENFLSVNGSIFPKLASLPTSKHSSTSSSMGSIEEQIFQMQDIHL